MKINSNIPHMIRCNVNRRYIARLKLPAILLGAFVFGSVCGKLTFFLNQTEPQVQETSAEATGWGLSFQEEGKRPVGNASPEELKQYDAYYAADTEDKVIYLTFDCGYENGNTPAILDALNKHQVSATFFVVGNFISDEPELIRRMAEEGHTVGNHTFTHPNMSKISEKAAFVTFPGFPA